MLTRDISSKANRVLNFIILAFLLILVRVWFLCVVEHEFYVDLSKKPQKKTVVEKPSRGTIRDRFNLPLAVNKLQYDAAICYDHIREFPSVVRLKNEEGKLIKTYPRREYIHKLAHLLAHKLELDALDIEDLIYSKAALFPSTPFILKEDLPEPLYYELKGLEREYAGICTLRNSKRYYPRNKVAADLIGYIGPVNEQEYFSLSSEIESLQASLKEYEEGRLIFLPKGFSSFQEMKERLHLLKKKTRSLNDKLGKAGIEAKFDELLQGSYGKKVFEVNTKGSIVRTLPGSTKAIPGERILLNISAELQEFAEALLAENESLRDSKFIRSGKDHHFVSPPWIKGGAIVAMIPTTGEIVALASYPRMNNNDFIVSKSQSSASEAAHWLENSSYIANLWDGKNLLEREFYSFNQQSFYTEAKKLTLDHYLERVLSLHGPAKKAFQRIVTLSSAVEFQKSLLFLLDLSEQPYMHALIDTLYAGQHKPSVFATNAGQIEEITQALSQHEFLVKEARFLIDKILVDIPCNNDKLLVIDILQLIAPATAFSSELLAAIGSDPLPLYRKLCQAFAITADEIKNLTKECFHLHDFRTWRTEHFKTYLAEKRLEEKENKRYQKPYTDYLKRIERTQFQIFWDHWKWDLITRLCLDPSHLEELPSLAPYIHYFSHPKKGLSAQDGNREYIHTAIDLLRNRLKSLDPTLATQYLKTMRSYRDLSRKLYGYYPQIKKRKGSQTEQDLAAAFYPPSGYGHGRSFAFRQSTPLGSIFKIITAYEALKQNYERGVYHNTKDLNPLTIIDELQASTKSGEDLVLGFHEDGKKITRHYKGGTLPRTHNRSLGKVDYIKAFERSSNIYFSLLAGDVIQEPNDLTTASLKFGFGNKTGIDLPGEIPGVLPKDLNENRSGLYAFAIGQHSLIATPLQTAVMLSSLVNEGEVLKPQIVHLTAGIKPVPSTPFSGEDYAYKEYLNRVGIFFPFLLQTNEPKSEYDIKLYEKTLYRKLLIPKDIKDYLMEGLHSVISSPRGAARAELIRYFYNNTRAMRNYIKLKYQLAGKTSTAEIAYRPTLDRYCPPILCKDIWFGGIAFQPQQEQAVVAKKPEEIPELVVVVYLRFGDFGKETAPLAGEIVNKWREICKKYGKSSYLETLTP